MYPETFFFVPLTGFVSDYLIVSIVTTEDAKHETSFEFIRRVYDIDTRYF